MRDEQTLLERDRRTIADASPPSPPALEAGVRHRPRGWVRHYASLLTPSAGISLRVLTERNREQRVRRLGATMSETVRERRAPSRPRMRVLQAAPGARLSWRSAAAPPPPSAHGAVVHPIAAATCDVDCPLALGAGPFALPLHLGHECVAEVLAVGELVSTVKPGDLVVVPFQINCGACKPCLSGHTASCTSVPPVSSYGMGLATGHWGGAFSDEMAVPYADAMLVALPSSIDPVAAASLSDNVCDAYRHVAPHLPALLAADPDAEVQILAGMNEKTPFSSSCALYAGLIARALGARNVRVVDARAHLRAHAQRLDIDALHPRELHGLPLAPLVVDMTAGKLGLALSRTAADGICSSVGDFHASARIPIMQMYIRGVTLHVGLTHARALIPQVLQLMLDSGFAPELVTTTPASLQDAPQVLREHFLGGGTKAVLTA